jgi:hypothetical protein
MATLYSLGAVTVAGYRLRTGDNTSDGGAVSGSLVEAESLMEEELRRELPSESRSEAMIIHDCDGRMYPKAWPITVCTTNTIDGRTLLGGSPDLGTWLGLIDTDYSVTRRATITYTGGFTAATLPVTLAHAIYDLARALVADASPIPVGATSVSVGDVSVSYGSPSSSGGIDALVPGLGARVAKYRNRWV